MRPSLRRSTISILFLVLLCLCAAAPIVIISFFWQFSPSLGGIITERKEFIGRTSDSVKNLSHWQSADYLNSIEQVVNDEIKEPDGLVYLDGSATLDKDDRNSSSENPTGSGLTNVVFTSPSRRSGGGKGVHEHNSLSSPGARKHSSTTRLVMDEKIRFMEDQVIAARAFLHFAQPSSNSHLMRELKLRIKEIERVLSQASKDSDLHRSALQKMKAMENTLYKANKAYPDCSAMASKLRAMLYSTEEQLRAQINQVSYLIQLASRTFPKGFHCLSMQLTTEYFALPPEKRQLPYSPKFQKPDLYHYVVFSDNILACAVVVNSTIANSKEQEKIVFHVVTDSLNLPAMMMWFVMSPESEATIEVVSMDEFAKGYKTSPPLNHLLFHLPNIFPSLNKILLLDHDVVVQKDLRGLWTPEMGDKVIGVVETCPQSSCLWAFGMNIFNLEAWRNKSFIKLGQLLFYNQTFVLDRQWHLFGLGQDSTVVGHEDIEKAAVIHYSGLKKPWSEIAIAKYRRYWNKFLDYKHPYLQQCNIHP